MAEVFERQFPQRDPPVDVKRITTGCQYCAVGCGYNAFLVFDDGVPTETLQGISRFITPAMTNVANYKGRRVRAAVVPDLRCDLNKGNHSVRGGSQGKNLVTSTGRDRSTAQRLKSPQVRLQDGPDGLVDLTWDKLNDVMAQLVMHAADIKVSGEKAKVGRPGGLGVKLYEYQYLENTYAATKLIYSAIGTPNVAYHDRPSVAGSSPALEDVGFRPHDFSYDDLRAADVILFIGTNPYENQSVCFMQSCVGKEMIVLDPRETATAQYALATGGLHLPPTALGADSLVIYALARAIIEREGLAEPIGFEGSNALGGHEHPPDLSAGQQNKKTQSEKRRASRATNFDGLKQFLSVGDDTSTTYTLANAATISGIDRALLEEAVWRLAARRQFETGPLRRPKVALIYEKGAIWGFNFHNIAAIGSLGLLLGSYSMPGRLVGRVGGHQKGWAESKADLKEVFDNSDKLDAYNEGYPFRNVVDQYEDKALKVTSSIPAAERFLYVHHNLDTHVFGPPPELNPQPIPSSTGAGVVRLDNGVTTVANPDVLLLWIIGGNYLGQTNDCHRKRGVLHDRRTAGADHVRYPATASVRDIVQTLTRRMLDGGLVMVHQDIFPQPTTNEADLVIPAAGWGEDTFCRYNAERRLKLYDRFQDMPLHKKDRAKLIELQNRDPMKKITRDGEPALRIDKLAHSPKPDWMIIRDVARAIGWRLDGAKKRPKPADRGPFAQKLVAAFPWVNSSDVADEMARLSHRGLAGGNMLGDIYLYGKSARIDSEVFHRVLGKKVGSERHDGMSAFLLRDGYTVGDGKDPVYGNGIATNGIMLPAVGKDENGEPIPETGDDRDGKVKRIQGTLSVPHRKPLYFVKAPWSEIESDFQRVNQQGVDPDEVFVTNGRFNHLWNNMFHHLRNDYTSERYPEDLPGTILEINRAWADARQIRTDDIVDVGSGGHSFRAVASLQDSVPEGGAFAMFSYPARQHQAGQLAFNFQGYANNITDGYADGINPIAALKYARAVVKKTGENYQSPRLPGVPRRLGPSHASRGIIVRDQNNELFPISAGFVTDLDAGHLPDGLRTEFSDNGTMLSDEARVVVIRPTDRWRIIDFSAAGMAAYFIRMIDSTPRVLSVAWSYPDRVVWEMRELIVTKGLPRALIPDPSGGASEHSNSTRLLFLDPDAFVGELADPNGHRRGALSKFKIRNMIYKQNQSTIDRWQPAEIARVQEFLDITDP